MKLLPLLGLAFYLTLPNIALYTQPFNYEMGLVEAAKELSKSYADSLMKYKIQTGGAQRSAYKYASELGLYTLSVTGLDGEVLPTAFGDAEAAENLRNALRLFNENIKKLERWYFAHKIVSNVKKSQTLKTSWKLYEQEFNNNRPTKALFQSIMEKEVIRNWLFFRKKAYDFTQEIYNLSEIKGKATFSFKSVKEHSYDRTVVKEMPLESMESITAGGSISADKIGLSYPINGQFNFYSREFKLFHGFLKLRTFVPELQDLKNGESLWAKWKNTKGEVIFTEATYVPQQSSVFYGIPASFLENNMVHELSLVTVNQKNYLRFYDFYGKIPLHEIINNSIWHLEVEGKVPPEKVFFKAYFRTSRHAKFFSKIPSQTFSVLDQGKKIFQLDFDEPLGPEEIRGLHGVSPLAEFSFDATNHIRNNITKLYTGGFAFFLSHLNEEYITKLKNNIEIRPKLDSIVDLEFRKYNSRRQRMNSSYSGKVKLKEGLVVEGQRVLPVYPEEEYSREFINLARMITAADFHNKRVFNLDKGKVRVEYKFEEFASKLLPQVQEIIQIRKKEYVKLLAQIDQLEGRKLKYQKGTYEEALESILPKEINHILSLRELVIPTEASLAFKTQYRLPGGNVLSLVDKKKK